MALPRLRPSIALIAVGMAAALLGPAAGPGAAADYSTRATFETLDQSWNAGRGNLGQPNDAPDYARQAWGESYFLQAYLAMYGATGDVAFVERLIEHIDATLAVRDSARGVRDYLGRSLPAWRGGAPYTVGAVVLPDAQGRPALEVRSALAFANHATAQISPGTAPGTFRLTVTNARAGLTDVYDDLVMDPADPRYAPRRVAEAFSTSQALVTARDARSSPDAAGAPTPRTAPFATQYYLYAVHTGQITYPIARFVRLVRETPALLSVPRYAAKADEYLVAVEQAVAVHEPEWVPDGAGGGSYIFPRGAPVRYDGADQPVNQQLSLGRTYAELALITGSPAHAARVAAMARTFAADLRPAASGAYVWTYAYRPGRFYRGWRADEDISDNRPSQPGFRSVETTSDGHIDVGFAVSVVGGRLAPGGLDDDDARSLALTFTRHLATLDPAGQPTVWDLVDGSGNLHVYDNIAAAWMPLGAWDGGIYPHVLASYNARQPRATVPSVVLGSALLNQYARTGGPAGPGDPPPAPTPSPPAASSAPPAPAPPSQQPAPPPSPSPPPATEAAAPPAPAAPRPPGRARPQPRQRLIIAGTVRRAGDGRVLALRGQLLPARPCAGRVAVRILAGRVAARTRALRPRLRGGRCTVAATLRLGSRAALVLRVTARHLRPDRTRSAVIGIRVTIPQGLRPQ